MILEDSNDFTQRIQWNVLKNLVKSKSLRLTTLQTQRKMMGLSIFTFCSSDFYKFSSSVRRGPSAAVKNRKESILQFKGLSGKSKIIFKIKEHLFDYLIFRSRHFLGYFTVDLSFLKREHFPFIFPKRSGSNILDFQGYNHLTFLTIYINVP